MNTQYQNFGEFLQRKRTEKQITLRKMAEMIGITAPYLTDIEKDRRNPPEMEKLELISQILMLNDEDKTTMYDLAGKKRNSVAQTCLTISWNTTMCPLRFARHVTLMQARLTG